MKIHSKRPLSVLASTLALVAVVAFAGIAGAQQPGEGVTINMGKASWTSADPVAFAVVELLEELGYRVNGPRMFSSNSLAFLSVSTGDLDIFPNGWFPLHYPQLPANWDATGAFAGTLCEGCTLEGYLVNDEAIEAFDITNLDDFKRPEVKAAFDANGDGKADLYGCPPGWGCHETIEEHLDIYDLRDHINHVTADYVAGFADARARIANGEPTLYYTWGPSAMLLELPPGGGEVHWIGVPHLDEKAAAHQGFDDDALTAVGLEGTVTDPLMMGFVPGDIVITANKRFLENNPAAATLLSKISLPLEWINQADARLAAGEDSEAEIRAMAREWIEANRETVDEWLDAARAAAN